MDLRGGAAAVAAVVIFYASAHGQVILNEFLANPADDLATEWIELYVVSGDSVPLGNWAVGDSRIEYTLGVALTVSAGDYIVLADDTVEFRTDYPGFSGALIEPVNWPTLNNSGDTVRLLDPDGIEVDRFGYDEGFDANFTWCRTNPHTAEWGRSANRGGSPGEENRLVHYAAGSEITIRVEPRIFSPDGDGTDDWAAIYVRAPEADSYSLRIFDRNGVDVHARIDGDYANQPYIWRGARHGGARAPVGIYIVYFETSEGEAARQTVVVAR